MEISAKLGQIPAKLAEFRRPDVARFRFMLSVIFLYRLNTKKYFEGNHFSIKNILRRKKHSIRTDEDPLQLGYLNLSEILTPHQEEAAKLACSK